MTTKPYNDIPAFPLHERDDALRGMTLRDYFAGQVLAGILSVEDQRTFSETVEGLSLQEWRKVNDMQDAEYCYRLADALLAAREAK